MLEPIKTIAAIILTVILIVLTICSNAYYVNKQIDAMDAIISMSRSVNK